MNKSVVLSACGQYRYVLTRDWDKDKVKSRVLWIMLNPSTADADRDDATLKRIIAFTKGWDCGGLSVVNLFALRSFDPKRLLGHADPIGPENDQHIARQIREHSRRQDYIVVAWGTFASRRELRPRRDAVLSILPVAETNCLETTQRGDPKHPLYTLNDRTPNPYEFPTSVWRGR